MMLNSFLQFSVSYWLVLFNDFSSSWNLIFPSVLFPFIRLLVVYFVLPFGCRLSVASIFCSSFVLRYFSVLFLFTLFYLFWIDAWVRKKVWKLLRNSQIIHANEMWSTLFDISFYRHTHIVYTATLGVKSNGFPIFRRNFQISHKNDFDWHQYWRRRQTVCMCVCVFSFPLDFADDFRVKICTMSLFPRFRRLLLSLEWCCSILNPSRMIIHSMWRTYRYAKKRNLNKPVFNTLSLCWFRFGIFFYSSPCLSVTSILVRFLFLLFTEISHVVKCCLFAIEQWWHSI